MDEVVLKSALVKIDSLISDIGTLKSDCTDKSTKKELEYIFSLMVAIQSKLLIFGSASEGLDNIDLSVNEILSLEKAITEFVDEDEEMENLKVSE